MSLLCWLKTEIVGRHCRLSQLITYYSAPFCVTKHSGAKLLIMETTKPNPKTKTKAAPHPLGHYSHEQLIHLVEELQEEKRMSEAFGQISETGSNDAALMWQGRNRFLAENVPPVSLQPDAARSFQSERGEHRIIDGNNLAVMRSLLTDFRGGPNTGFDVIYFDPPYNTGEDTFAYNDNYRFSTAELGKHRNKVRQVDRKVGLDDPSRHTKWINHIAPRLWAARKLMKHSGVIIVSIDEHELPRLWMLLGEMFGEHNRLATLIWERSRKNDAKYISEGHEYMLVWARDKSALDEVSRKKGKWRERKPGLEPFLAEFNRLREFLEDDYEAISAGLKTFVRGIKKGSPLWTIRQYVGVDAKCGELGPYIEDNPTWPSGQGPTFDVPHPETGIPVRTPPKGWRISSLKKFMDLHAADRIEWKGAGTPKIKKYLLEGRENDVFTSVIQKEARQSVMMLDALLGFGDAINHPKDHLVLKRLFNLVTWSNPNAQILDAYAGSGTTGHAVLEMNAEDGPAGQRRCVLIEYGDPSNKKLPRDEYTDRLTAERLRRVISGQWADGKEHPTLDSGFTFYQGKEEMSRAYIMAATRENLADIILQIVEEDSNRIDCRMDGYKYLIGRTRNGFGIALLWENGANGKNQPLTAEILDIIIDEAHAAGVVKPVFVYATQNIAPFSDDLYRFQQIPDSILARLLILHEAPSDEEGA